MDFTFKDYLVNGVPLPKFDLQNHHEINIDNILSENEIFSKRTICESWDEYYHREKSAISSIERIIFHEFIEKSFVFAQLPENSRDERYEFDFSGRVASGTLAVDGSGTFRSYYRSSCYNEHLIYQLFGFPNNIKYVLRNTIDNLLEIARLNEGKVTVPFWLARTGIMKRTKHLESLSSGQQLLFFKKGRGTYELFDLDGNSLGDILDGNDRVPPYATTSNEYLEIFQELDASEAITLTKVTLTEVVEHGSYYGRPRKALAKVILEYNVSSEKLCQLKQDFTSLLKQNINCMSLLAKIDYNRKCEIIREVIPNRFKLADLFPITAMDNIDEYQLLVDENIDRLCIKNVNMSLNELECFWNLYSPTICCVRNERPINTNLFSIKNDLLFRIYNTYYKDSSYMVLNFAIYRRRITR